MYFVHGFETNALLHPKVLFQTLQIYLSVINCFCFMEDNKSFKLYIQFSLLCTFSLNALTFFSFTTVSPTFTLDGYA